MLLEEMLLEDSDVSVCKLVSKLARRVVYTQQRRNYVQVSFRTPLLTHSFKQRTTAAFRTQKCVCTKYIIENPQRQNAASLKSESNLVVLRKVKKYHDRLTFSVTSTTTALSSTFISLSALPHNTSYFGISDN